MRRWLSEFNEKLSLIEFNFRLEFEFNQLSNNSNVIVLLSSDQTELVAAAVDVNASSPFKNFHKVVFSQVASKRAICATEIIHSAEGAVLGGVIAVEMNEKSKR